MARTSLTALIPTFNNAAQIRAVLDDVRWAALDGRGRRLLRRRLLRFATREQRDARERREETLHPWSADAIDFPRWRAARSTGGRTPTVKSSWLAASNRSPACSARASRWFRFPFHRSCEKP